MEDEKPTRTQRYGLNDDSDEEEEPKKEEKVSN